MLTKEKKKKAKNSLSNKALIELDQAFIFVVTTHPMQQAHMEESRCHQPPDRI